MNDNLKRLYYENGTPNELNVDKQRSTAQEVLLQAKAMEAKCKVRHRIPIKNGYIEKWDRETK